MAQTIKIKRSTGSSAPATLAQGELAYSKGSDTFYVGDPAAANTPIAVGGAIKNNAGTPVLATGITAAEIRSLISVDPAGTDNSTNVSLNTASHDYLSLSGQAITLGAIDLAADVTGTLPIANGGTGATTEAGARTSLGLAIGTDVQAYDAALGSIAGLTHTAGKMLYTTGADTYALAPITAAGRALLDDASASDQRTTLGLGSLATLSAVGAAQITDNSVGATQLNVTDNGTSGQHLVSDGDGSFSWVTPTDNDVSVSNLEARLSQIDTDVTIGNGVTITAGGDFVVTGDLTVSGTTTTVNSETISLADNIIELNSNLTVSDTPTEDAGIRVNRGSEVDHFLYWSETNDRWEVSYTGATGGTPVGSITSVAAGTGLSGGGTSGGVTLSLDFAELTDMTGDISGTTEFILQNGAVESRKAASEIKLSAFNNDAGWTSNVGDITAVTISSTDGSISGTGTGSTGAITFDLEVASIDGGTY